MGCYVHNVPGRLRVKSERFKHRKSGAGQAEKLLSGLYGIDGVKTKDLTGSIVIHYDPDVFSSDQLINILRHYDIIGANQPIHYEKPVGERSTKAGMALGKAVFSWAVGKALQESGLGFLAVFI
jgi:hypothetical protein